MVVVVTAIVATVDYILVDIVITIDDETGILAVDEGLCNSPGDGLVDGGKEDLDCALDILVDEEDDIVVDGGAFLDDFTSEERDEGFLKVFEALGGEDDGTELDFFSAITPLESPYLSFTPR